MTPSADPPGAGPGRSGEAADPAAVALGRLAEVAPALVAAAERSPAEEVCGLVEAGPDGVPRVRLLRNAAPSPRRAFALAPLDLLAALRRLEREGGVLLAIFHSHPAGGADLSAEDLGEALCDGAPLWPGVAQVVIGLSAGRAEVVRAHRWEGDRYRPDDLWRRGAAGRSDPAAARQRAIHDAGRRRQ